MPANNPVPAYLGQVQIAPDSSGSPGTFAAVSEGAKFTPTHKVGQQDYSPAGGGIDRRRLGTLIDVEGKLDTSYDSGDVGLANLHAAAFAQLPMWVRDFDSATAYAQLCALCQDLTWDSGDPSGITKVSASLMLDGTQSSPWTRSTGGVLIPATAPAPAAAYKSIVSLNTPATTTAMTAEACTLVSGKTYRITNVAHRLLDPSVAVVVKENSGAITTNVSNIANVDMMLGTVTFASTYTPTANVTIDGSYLTLNQIVLIKKYTSQFKWDLKDTTDLNSAGYVKRRIVARDYSGSFSVQDLAASLPQNSSGNVGASSWFSLVNTRTPLVVEHDPDGTQNNVARAWVNLESDSEDLGFGDVVMQNISATLSSRTNGIYLAGFSVGKAN